MKPDWLKLTREALINALDEARICADEDGRRIRQLVNERAALRKALLSLLNIEGAALHGARLPAFEGLDVPYHFAKARAALALGEV